MKLELFARLNGRGVLHLSIQVPKIHDSVTLARLSPNPVAGVLRTSAGFLIRRTAWLRILYIHARANFPYIFPGWPFPLFSVA